MTPPRAARFLLAWIHPAGIQIPSESRSLRAIEIAAAAGLLLLVLLGIPPSAAQAQDSQEATGIEAGSDTTSTDSGDVAPQASGDGEIPPFSTQSRQSFFDRIDFHPRYDSGYAVNRTSITWRQGMTMNRDFGPLSASNRWSVDIQKNEAQNNRRQQNGRSTNSVGYAVDGAGGWVVGTDFEISRRFLTTDFNRTVDNGTEVDLVTTSGLLGHALRQQIDADEDAVDWSVTGAWGLTRKTQINETRSRTDGTVTRADSTGTEGTARRLESTLQLAPDASWDLQMTGLVWRSASDASTEQFGADSLITAENKSWENRFDATGSWRPARNTVLTFTGRVKRSAIQDYNRIIQAQDTVTGVDESAEVQLDARPLWGIRTIVRATSNALRSDYQVQESDRTTSSERLYTSLEFNTAPVWRFLSGTNVVLEFEVESGRTTFSDDRAQHYDSRRQRMMIDVSRPIGKKLSATLGGEALLTQRFYDEGDQDDDDLRTFFDAALKYDLAKNVDATVNMRWNSKEIVKIRASQSANSTKDTDLIVGANYEWRIRPNVTFSQRYSVQAQAKELAFRDDESQLQRTSDVVSTIDSSIGRRVGIELEHKFNFRDSGQFAVDSSTGIRSYGKDREDDWQYLLVDTTYDLIQGKATLHAEQKYEIRESRNLTTESRSRNPKTELTWGATFNHEIAEGFSVGGFFDRTSSTQQPSYWMANVSLNRVF